MSKSPAARIKRKSKRFNYRGQPEKALVLIKANNKVKVSITDFYGEKTVKALSLFISSAFDQLYINTFNGARLFDHDNYLLSAYNDLAQSYKNIVRFYREFENEFDNNDTTKIASGMITVIDTRLNEYMEVDVNASYEEKISTTNRYLMKFVRQSESIIRRRFRLIVGNISELALKDSWVISSDTWPARRDEIKSIITENFALHIFDAYSSCLGEAHKAMDNEEYRSHISSRFEMINQEMDILGSIIKIQIPELEKQAAENCIMDKILSMIREAYQRLGRDIEHINNLYKQAEYSSADATYDYDAFLMRTHDVFLHDISFNSNIDDFILSHSDTINLFKAKFNDSLKSYVDVKLRTFDSDVISDMAYKTRKNSLSLSEKICKIFKDIIEYTNDNQSDFIDLENEKQIIDGIKETISIKIQSIEEYAVEFHDSLTKFVHEEVLLEDLISKSFMEEGLKKASEFWMQEFNGYIALTRNEFRTVNSFMKEQSSVIADGIFQTVNKKVKATEEKILNMYMKFKKECLLFEITTFEEILNYSISKLKESQNQHVLDYTEAVENANNDIQYILKTFNIERIYPNAHDIFNGKEHEVLMAKETEGFEKGEIVKVINSGYRQDGIVIIRANVIAAK